MTPTALITIPCSKCGGPVEVLPEYAQYGAICDPCNLRDHKMSCAGRIGQLKQDHWSRICPALYQDTAIERLPYPNLSERALQWAFTDALGLNLWGYPRTGKTRTMLLVLKREFDSGKSIRFLGPSQFSMECEARAYHTGSWVTELINLNILAFDDIDKCKMTKVQEEKFFAVLDGRARNKRPTFFTGNSTGEELLTHFHNGKAIVERLRHHCKSIHFPQQQTMI